MYTTETRESRVRGYEGTPRAEFSLKRQPNLELEVPYEHSQTRRRLESSSMVTGDSYYPSPGPSQSTGSPYAPGPPSGYLPTATSYVSPSGYPAYTTIPASVSIPAGYPVAGDPRYGPSYIYDTPMQGVMQGGYPQDSYYTQGSAHDPQRRRDQLPYSSNFIQDPSGPGPRYVDDRPPPIGYGYDPPYAPAPPSGYASTSYRGQPSSQYDPLPSRDPYGGRSGPQQDPYPGQRRRN